jgi:cytochrome c-type biogenesis protein CcmH/NrfG
VVVLPLLIGTARRALAERAGHGDRPLRALCFAVALAWAIHAGVDWDWEMPAVTLPALALAAAAVGRERSASSTARGAGWPVRAVVATAAVALAVMPLAAAYSQTKLDDAVRAMKDGECGRSIDSALASEEALPARAEPWEVIGYCRSRLGDGTKAVSALRKAVDRDPLSWELHYGLALVEGAAGMDPRQAAREALRLNPKEPRAQNAVSAFARPGRARWRREALRAPLPLP